MVQSPLFQSNYGSDAGFTLPGLGTAGGNGSGRFDSLQSFGAGNISGNTTTDPFQFGMNPESVKMVGEGLGAFSSLANIYAGFKAMKLAKDQFKFQKNAFNKNFAASAKDYSNTLKDKWAARSASNAARGKSFGSMNSYVAPREIDATPI